MSLCACVKEIFYWFFERLWGIQLHKKTGVHKDLIGKTGEIPARSRHCNAERIQQIVTDGNIGKAGGARKQSQENCLFCTTVWPTSDRKVCFDVSLFDVHISTLFLSKKGGFFDFIFRFLMRIPNRSSYSGGWWQGTPFSKHFGVQIGAPSRRFLYIRFISKLPIYDVNAFGLYIYLWGFLPWFISFRWW